MADLKRLLRYMGPYRKDMVIGALLIVVETAFELFIPLLMADLIDVGVANHDTAYILHKGIQMGICALFALITGLMYCLLYTSTRRQVLFFAIATFIVGTERSI